MSSEPNRKGASGKAKWAVLAAVVVLAGGAAAYRVVRGPSGATEAQGGSIAAEPAPELPADAARWVNGEPVAAAGGHVLFVEGWHPA